MLTRFWQLIKPPVYEQEEKNRVANWLQVMLVFIALAALLLALNSILFFPTSGSWPISLVNFSVAIAALYFNRRGRMTVATLILLLWLLIDSTRSLFIGNGIHDTALLFFAAIVTLGGLLLRRRAYLVLFIMVVAAISFIVVSEMRGWVVSPLSPKTDYSDILMISVFLGGQALVITLVMDGYFKSLQAERRNAQTLRSLINAFTDPMFLIDSAGYFLYANEAQKRSAESCASPLIGTSSFDRLPLDLAREYRATVADVVASGQPYRTEHYDLGRWFEHNFYPIPDEQGQVDRIAIYIRDVTFYRQAAEEITKLNFELEQRVHERTAQLEAANKELEAFSYSISHDLRSPLRSINGFSRILEEDFSRELHPMALGFLRKIRSSGEKMTQLIDELLKFSRLGRKSLERQDIALSVLVQNVIESFSSEISNRQIEWILAELPQVNADSILIQQVYANLIGNAIKYTGKREKARIEIGICMQDAETVYFVRDNGAGFDMQHADNLFGVFQRMHRDDEFEGTGIGLAIVRRIIERHGGCIWAEAEVDKGATFYFTLG